VYPTAGLDAVAKRKIPCPCRESSEMCLERKVFICGLAFDSGLHVYKTDTESR